MAFCYSTWKTQRLEPKIPDQGIFPGEMSVNVHINLRPPMNEWMNKRSTFHKGLRLSNEKEQTLIHVTWKNLSKSYSEQEGRHKKETATGFRFHKGLHSKTGPSRQRPGQRACA